jgi:hypothetical protein
MSAQQLNKITFFDANNDPIITLRYPNIWSNWTYFIDKRGKKDTKWRGDRKLSDFKFLVIHPSEAYEPKSRRPIKVPIPNNAVDATCDRDYIDCMTSIANQIFYQEKGHLFEKPDPSTQPQYLF